MLFEVNPARFVRLSKRKLLIENLGGTITKKTFALRIPIASKLERHAVRPGSNIAHCGRHACANIDQAVFGLTRHIYDDYRRVSRVPVRDRQLSTTVTGAAKFRPVVNSH